ncbi:MAG: polysaccharide deacetylase family protein [Saprospiraceae bacterium]|nr:polysaccharide deacetylase family protein [Saprospiraceae bacterium]
MGLLGKFKSQLSKIKFALSFNPIIEKSSDREKYIPRNYDAVFTLTADFELAWAPRYNNTSRNSYQDAIRLARQERENIPKLLTLFDQYNIPITWATVGHLFLDSCEMDHQGKKHSEIPPVPEYNGPYWDFHNDDWFEYDPCTNLEEDPEWYAPDLVQMILESKVKHEIGCHTFSHIDCRDEVCPSDLFISEITKCQALAKAFDIEMKSFVHPGHTVGNLDNLALLGFTSFQSDPGNILGYPIQHQNGLWEFKRTMDCYLRKEWSIDYHINRYKKIIDRAIQSNTLCNLWFHPSLSPVFVNDIFPALLAYIDSKRDSIWITTVGDYVAWLNHKQEAKLQNEDYRYTA